MTIIDTIASFFDDLFGCVEGTAEYAECHAKSRKWATWIILIAVVIILLIVVPKLYRLIKGK